MSQYSLLGKKINFSLAEDNFYELQVLLWQSIKKSRKEYESWYKNQGGIVNIINNSEAFFYKTIENNLLTPLYSMLDKKFQIFGVSKNDCFSSCLDISTLESVINRAIAVYNDIQEQLEEELEEREFNEDLRKSGQISFGIGDTLINAASNVAHGVAKSSGDASSQSRASEQKTKLFNDVFEPMWDELETSLTNTITNYQEFVNTKKADSIVSYFHRDKSDAYLENAKNNPNERDELLVEAFTYCPWNIDVHSYIFHNYPKERKNILEISKKYELDLTDDINSLLRAEYKGTAKSNEADAILAKNKIKSIMEEIGVTDSIVIDEIEFDCLSRLIQGLKNASEKQCNEMKTSIQNYDALERNKKQFFEKIQARIEEIWAKEDGDIFDNYLKQANILSSAEVKKGITFVKQKGRTSDAKKYQTAFEHCTKQNINKARIFQRIRVLDIGFVKYIGWILIGIGVLLFIIQEGFSFWTQLLPIIIGGIYQYRISDLKSEWEAITVNGKVIHCALNLDKKEFEAKYLESLANNKNNSQEKQ